MFLTKTTKTTFKGCYWTNLNPENLIDHATAYETYKHWPASSLAYGVSDNATQVLIIFNKLLKPISPKITVTHSSFEVNAFTNSLRLTLMLFICSDFIPFLITTMAKQVDGVGTNGDPYLGKHTPQCQYLDEEQNIDYVLIWHLYPLKKERKLTHGKPHKPNL